MKPSFPTHAAASRIAEAAKDMGYQVRRSAASPKSRSTYVFCNNIKVRIADHPTQEKPDIDVHVDEPRPGSITAGQAIKQLKRKL